ncbi:MAG: hypothetical protein K2K84_09720 [Muribaculaceae bacterium]|nr:hypothetical protein [Muribaculaceae bacterium]
MRKNDRVKTDAKLRFARQMKKYKHDMTHAPTADERGIARLMYAIGRRNSFEECWALTQYWRGTGIDRFYPVMYVYYDDEFANENYAFLYDYEDSVGHKKTEEIFDRECKKALAMLTGDEAKAKADYILGNLLTVVKRYSKTKVAAFVRTSCDNWRHWL